MENQKISKKTYQQISQLSHSIEYVNSLGYNFLMTSCLKQDFSMVKYALELKFDPNTFDYYNVMTPLLLVVNKLSWKSVLIANILVKAGADPYKHNSVDTSAISVLSRLNITDPKKIEYRKAMMKIFGQRLELV